MSPTLLTRSPGTVHRWLFCLSWLANIGCFPILSGCRGEASKSAGSKQTISDKQTSLAKAWFRDATSEVGLDFIHDAGPTGSYFMPQIMGSGAAVFDFDNDNRLDLYLLQNGGPDSAAKNRLYRQLPSGQFQDASTGSGLDLAGYNMGVAIGDIDNDSFADVLVTSFGGVRLFRNRGDGSFVDITASAGLDSVAWGTSASFVDYDRDGWLDLVVVNYVDYDATRHCIGRGTTPEYCHPKEFANTVSLLFHNLGKRAESDIVGFDNVTVSSGLANLTGPGLGVVCADFDGDGWQDIFIANDNHANHLWINQHNGTFVDEALIRGLAFDTMGRAPSNMGIALGDIDADGLFDIVVTHIVNELHNVWRQGPRGVFSEQTSVTGLGAPRWRGTGFGTVLEDFDLSGTLDLAVVNGAIQRNQQLEAPELDPFWQPYAERNQLFSGARAGRFEDISLDNAALCGLPTVSRGLATGDLNGDGAVDLLTTSIAAPARIYFNSHPRTGHWLTVRALDWPRPRDAYGAEVTVRVGSKSWTRWLNPGSSYMCSNSPWLHFGLGEHEHVDSIAIQWPDGTKETFKSFAADQSIVLKKGEGSVAVENTKP